MTLKEAILSGKHFRPVGTENWLYFSNKRRPTIFYVATGIVYNIEVVDVLDDWEIKL